MEEASALEHEKPVLQKPGGLLGSRAAGLSERSKFALALTLGIFWAAVALLLALPWIEDLGDIITFPLALLVIFGLAIIPGYLAAFLLTSILFDKPETLPPPSPREGKNWPGVSVLIAAYNEEHQIGATLVFPMRKPKAPCL